MDNTQGLIPEISLPRSDRPNRGEEFFDNTEAAINRLKELKEEATHYDEGKTRFDLVPPAALNAIAQVFTWGAQHKYGPRNWEKGKNWGSFFGSAMRHLWAYWMGEDKDTESGLSHLAHAAWNVMVLLDYQLLKRGTDDRPEIPKGD